MAGQNWGSSGVADEGEEQSWVRGTSGSEKAVAELQAETHQEVSEPAASGRLAEASGHLPKGLGQIEEVPGQVTAAGANRSAGKGHQAAVNKNDLQKLLKLHAEVSISLSESCWVSIPPSQHHARVSANVGAAKGMPFCNNHMTALSSSPHQTPFCSKSILAVSSDARGCQHGMHMHHYCMPAIKCCFPSSTLTSTASSRQMQTRRHNPNCTSECDYLTQVQRCLKLCGQQLLNDRRIKCAQAHVTANRADPTGARADLSIAGADPDGPKQIVSLAAVAQRAQRGQFDSLEAFAEAVRQTVARICQSVEDRVKRQGRHSKPGQAG